MTETNIISANNSEIKSTLQEIKSKIEELESKKQELITSENELMQQFTVADKKLGWKEKIVGGAFGGNKSLLDNVDELKTQIQQSKDDISSINTRIKNRSAELTGKLKAYLEANDSAYSKIISARRIHYKLYTASKNYYTLVEKSHQGVVDVLLFASWNKLINHPKAAKKLEEFKIATKKYQTAVERFNHKVADNPIGSTQFVALIKFSSKEVAMSSFQKIAARTNKYLKFADRYLTQSKQEILAYRAKALSDLTVS